jgi:cadmium resistance protein CadD (predicted permease)
VTLLDALSLAGIGAGAFIATDIDDLVILVVLFLDGSVRPGSVVAGQFLGIGVLVAVGFLGSLGMAFLPREVIGLLGLIPLGLGIQRLLRREELDEDDVQTVAIDAAPKLRQILGIAAITIGSGGDNIGTYVPLFALHPGTGSLILTTTFAAMTGLWCAAAYGLTSHPILRRRVEWIGEKLLPYVLMIVGLFILLHGHSYFLLGQLFYR